MARAVHMQAGVVLDNILSLINGRPASHEYLPMTWIEGSIALTVGKVSLLPLNFLLYMGFVGVNTAMLILMTHRTTR